MASSPIREHYFEKDARAQHNSDPPSSAFHTAYFSQDQPVLEFRMVMHEEIALEQQDTNSTPNDGAKGREAITPALMKKVESALKSQASPAAAHVRKMRAKNPRLKPAGILRKLDRQLLTTATTTGAAAGASAAAPGIGEAATAALTLGGSAVSFPAAVFYILCVTEVYQIPVSDLDHRRKLALAILLAGGADTAIPKVAERTGRHWSRKTLKHIPASALKPLNDVFGDNFITKMGDKQGIVVLAKVLPYAFGAAIGGGYSFVTTSSVIGATKLAFGPPKAAFDDDDVLEEGQPE